jgi:hypothetical protein
LFELGHLRNKIFEILSDNFGTPNIGDATGNFIVHVGSVVVYVEPSYDQAATPLNVPSYDQFSKHLCVEVVCPVICDVQVTDELCRWVAVDGQWFMYGSFQLNAVPDRETAWVYFRYGIRADDLHESDLIHAVVQVAAVADRTAEELQGRFGGELYVSLLDRIVDS